MILNERNIRHEHAIEVAKQMMTAARTAPKGKGIDIIEIVLIEGEHLKTLSNKMIAMVDEHIFFGFDDGVELDIRHHAGGGEQTQISFKQAEKCDFPAFLRYHIGAQLAGMNEQNTNTVKGTIVNDGSFFCMFITDSVFKLFLLSGS